MPKIYDVMFPNGQYNDNNGQEKTRWMKVGMIVKTQAGKIALKIDNMPVNPPPNQNGEGGLWLQCFEPNQDADNRHTANAPAQGGFREKPAPQPTQTAPQRTQAPAGGFDDDDIPF